MLSELLLKDVKIAWRTKIYSIFEILVVLLVFAGAGYLTSYTLRRMEDDVFYPRNDFGIDNLNDIEHYTRCMGSMKYRKEDSEVTIRNIKNIGYNEECKQENYIGYESSPGNNQINITSTLKRHLYITNNWKSWSVIDDMQSGYEGGQQAYLMAAIMSAMTGPIPRDGGPSTHITRKPPPPSIPLGWTLLGVEACLILVVINVTRNIVHEKATFREYLMSMGLPMSTYYSAHFLFNLAKSLLILAPGLFFFAKVTKTFTAAFFLCVSALLFLFPAITFCFMIASIFKSQKPAILTCLVVWLTLITLPSLTIGSDIEKLMDYRLVLPTSLIFTFNMHYIGETLDTMVEFGEYNLWAWVGRVYPLWALWAGLLVNAAMMFGVAILVDDNGDLLDYIQRKKRSDYCDTGRENSRLVSQDETPRVNLKSDIELCDVVKVYASTGEVAVKGLTMRAIRGQVAVLLGHNGCGKSTTFSMISGMSQPTEGTIHVAGIDVVSKRAEARQKIGLCPQYNPLINRLTVWEHLKIVHALKKSKTSFYDDATQLLTSINLLENKDTLAENLSGGMKRKLCMCMALIGDSRVVLLDEPTAGMDSAARLDVATMLRASKTDRTILLTTHNMDEADKLADWVYVMADGRLEASGSAQFLKSKFGGGWLITVVVSEPVNDAQKLLEVCRHFVKDSRIKDTRGQMVEFNIPSDDRGEVIELLRCLEAISEQDFGAECLREFSEVVRNVQVTSIGVSLNSLEQVFINIVEKCEKSASSSPQKSTSLQKILSKKSEAPADFGPLSQFLGLSLKKIYHMRRNWILQLLNILIPLVLLLLVSNSEAGPEDVGAGVQQSTMDLQMIPAGSIIAIRSEDSETTQIQKYFQTNPNLIIRRFGVDQEISEILRTEQFFRRISVFVSMKNGNISEIWVNHRLELDVAIATFIKINYLTGKKFHFNWVLLEEPSGDRFETQNDLLTLALFAFLITYSISTCGFLHAEERVSKFKHQQFLSEMRPIVYWLTGYFWEFLIFAGISAILIGVLVVNGTIWGPTVGRFFLATSLTWLATSPIIFIFSFLVDTPTKITLLVIIFCYFVPFFKISADYAILYENGFESLRPLLPYTKFLFPFHPFITLIIYYLHIQSPESSYFKFLLRNMIPSKDKDVQYTPGSDILNLILSAIFYNFVIFLISSKFVRRSINKLLHSKHLARPRRELVGFWGIWILDQYSTPGLY